MNRLFPVSKFLAGFLVFGVLATPTASFADLIPTEELFKPSEFHNVRMSPDGLYVAAIARTPAQPDGQNLIVMNLSDRSVKVLTGYPEDEVTRFWWVTDQRLVFMLNRDFESRAKTADYLGTYAIDRDGSHGRRIHVPFEGDSRGGRGLGSSSGSGTGRIGGIREDFQVLDPWWANPDYILVQKINQRFRFPDVYKVNVNTGHMRKLTINETDIMDWYVDHKGQPRAGYSTGSDRDDLVMDIVYRSENSEEWKSIVTSTLGDFSIHGFDQDNRHVFLSSRNGEDRMKLYRVDGETGELGKPLVSDPDYDVDGRLVSTRAGKPIYFRYQTDKPRTLFFDQSWADRQSVIDDALPDTINYIYDWDDDETRFLVYSWSDRQVGDYYLLDEKEGKFSFILSNADWLDKDDMSPMLPISFAARDGLNIHGYLTLPINSGDGPFPLILNPHGGPYGIRDGWGFNREIQYLANRGYAVLQVNYRGSGGYGASFERDAYQRWGLEMQDDLTDAVLWAIDHGYAKHGKVCIYGASYGGYATLMGLIKTPELFSCGIDYVGVSDLDRLYVDIKKKNSVSGQDELVNWFHWAIGDPGKDKERFYETSPINHVEKIQAPLLIIHGVFDPIVPVEHARRLAGKLKSAGKEFEYQERRYEAHGFRTPANQVDLYDMMDEFLKKNLQ
ncbi:MAG: S9 family peptidase [Gammaproteobacteria bacterium]|nr:S9 family peptidase [Gammaproteobacteria bacterium]